MACLCVAACRMPIAVLSQLLREAEAGASPASLAEDPLHVLLAAQQAAGRSWLEVAKGLMDQVKEWAGRPGNAPGVQQLISRARMHLGAAANLPVKVSRASEGGRGKALSVLTHSRHVGVRGAK